MIFMKQWPTFKPSFCMKQRAFFSMKLINMQSTPYFYKRYYYSSTTINIWIYFFKLREIAPFFQGKILVDKTLFFPLKRNCKKRDKTFLHHKINMPILFSQSMHVFFNFHKSCHQRLKIISRKREKINQ